MLSRSRYMLNLSLRVVAELLAYGIARDTRIGVGAIIDPSEVPNIS
jgi:hypothetical protein